MNLRLSPVALAVRGACLIIGREWRIANLTLTGRRKVEHKPDLHQLPRD